MENRLSIDEKFLIKAEEVINENIENEHFSVEDLAREVGLSRSMLHRKMIKLTGKAASEWIMEIRLEKAKKLLEKNAATTSEIAYQVGFNSPSYFTKVFKKRFRFLPGDIRKGIEKKSINHSSNKYILKAKGTLNMKRFWKTGLIVSTLLLAVWSGLFFLGKYRYTTHKSIAILPFENLSPNLKNQYFADGIVEDLNLRLSTLKDLKVISRTSTEVFKSVKNKTIPDIARILEVNYILEGTIQQSGSKLRIHVQLIDAKNDILLFSRQFNRTQEDIFSIQNEIALQVASEISIFLSDDQKRNLKKNHTISVKAFENMQLGRFHLNKRSKDEVLISIKHFRKAISLDPEYALAYAELADAYLISSFWRFIEMKTGIDSAAYLAKRALELDANIGEAHKVLGSIYGNFEFNYELAEEEYLKAIETSPNHAPTYQYYAELLISFGEFERARVLVDKAIQLDPLSVIFRLISASLYERQNKNVEGLNEYLRGLSIQSNSTPLLYRIFVHYVRSGDKELAINTFKKLGDATGNWTSDEVDSAYVKSGINGMLWLQIERETWLDETLRFEKYALMGDDELTLSCLEAACEKGTLTPYNTTIPALTHLTSHPRYKAIRKKMGLPQLD